MSISCGCIEDIIKTGTNLGNIRVQAQSILSDTLILLSDSLYSVKAKFDNGHDIHQNQFICITKCYYITGKDHISVSSFTAEEMKDELIGKPNDILKILNIQIVPELSKQQTVKNFSAMKITKSIEDDDDEIKLNENEAVQFDKLNGNHSMKCVLKGLIVYKSEKITFKTKTSLFYVILQDEKMNEMKICFFNENIDKFFDSLEENQTIILNKVKLKQFNSPEILFNEKHFKQMIQFEGIVTYSTSIALAENTIQRKLAFVQKLNAIADNKFGERNYSLIGFVNELYEIERTQTLYSENKKWKCVIVDTTLHSIQMNIVSNCTVDLLKDELKKDSIVFITNGKVKRIANSFAKEIVIDDFASVQVINNYNDLSNEIQQIYSNEEYQQLIECKRNIAHSVITELTPKQRKTIDFNAIKSLKEYQECIKAAKNVDFKVHLIKAQIDYIKSADMNDLLYIGCETCKTKKEEGKTMCKKCKEMKDGKIFYRVNLKLKQADNSFLKEKKEEENNENNENKNEQIEENEDEIFNEILNDIMEEEVTEQWAMMFDDCARKLFVIETEVMNGMSFEEREEYIAGLLNKNMILKVRGKLKEEGSDSIITVIDNIIPSQ